MVSYSHLICPKGLYVAIVSATVETENAEEEIQPALDLLGDVMEMFVSVTPIFEPAGDGSANNLWVTSSYDATSHFESAGEEVLAIYEKIIGEKLDLNVDFEDDEEDEG